MSNILNAILDLSTKDSQNVRQSTKQTPNRINAVGDSLEDHIKNAFAGSLEELDGATREKMYSKVFSWTGNSNNPPDFMVKTGDAVEVKKIQGRSSQIQLNSSYPKQKLYANNPMITSMCRASEEWTEKDLIYCVGSVGNDRILSNLWLVYGDCFVASAHTYERVASAVSDGIIKTGLELNDSNELARVNKVDPLGITSLRVRGMWIIQHPEKVFKHHINKKEKNRNLNAIMLKQKFNSFSENDQKRIQQATDSGFIHISEIDIPSPDNPANLLQAIYITGEL